MIKINLIEKKKTFTAPVVLGFDFSNFPVKMFIIAIIFTQLPLSFFESYLEGVQSESDTVIAALNVKQKKLKREIKKNKKVAEQLKAFNDKIVALKKRGEQVDLIIKTRTNPRHLLEKLARLTPKKLWLNKITINEGKQIEIVGAADDHPSIQELLTGLNRTAFFNKGLQLKDAKTVEEGTGFPKVYVESFIINGKVNAFNPFIEGER